jgi:hypothetical protein
MARSAFLSHLARSAVTNPARSTGYTLHHKPRNLVIGSSSTGPGTAFPVLIVPRVEAYDPGRTIDGVTTPVYIPCTAIVTPSGCAINSYQWTWQAPQNAQNNPTVNFATPTAQYTIINNAHWFAYPYLDATKPLRLLAATSSGCAYTLNCTVSFPGAQVEDVTPPAWIVDVPLDPECKWPKIVGMVSTGVRVVGGVNQWYVTGMGPHSSGGVALSRSAPVVNPGTLPTTSQFYHKIVTVHEGRHAQQWLGPTHAGLTCHLLRNPTDLYNTTLVSLTSNVSEADLIGKVQQAIDARNQADGAVANAQRPIAEHDANMHATNLDSDCPDYLEQDSAEPTP